jgi:predicted nucleic acid-binding protein
LIAIVDTGPLLAAADRTDVDHLRCSQFLERTDLDLVIPALVVAEVAYLLGTRVDAKAEAGFLRTLPDWEVDLPPSNEWPLIADLVERYADFPLGATDASVAVLAERLDADAIVTLDHRHFGALRMSDGRPFRLLPD